MSSITWENRRLGALIAKQLNEVLQREANRHAREKLPPGSMSAAELAALIDERSAAVSR